MHRQNPTTTVIAVTVRVRLDITGVVQGVGFRPAVARIAAEYGLGGWVYNDAGSVHCEFEGPAANVDAAVSALQHRPPPMARIDTLSQRANDFVQHDASSPCPLNAQWRRSVPADSFPP
jgi:hydrogenase maturation protein HypF